MRAIAVLILIGFATLFWVSPHMGPSQMPDHGVAMAHDCPDCPDTGVQAGCQHGLACGIVAVLDRAGDRRGAQPVALSYGAMPARVMAGTVPAPTPPPPRA
ncbi:hypothetical protein [Thalassovita sp.]|uniref:hypothetical protein n=1 Tax=Thalassovita sp. TaxID=1979401 RepID=UPI0029DE6D40|nr:hypothetical protein [Thalassovita sp.]